MSAILSPARRCGVVICLHRSRRRREGDWGPRCGWQVLHGHWLQAGVQGVYSVIERDDGLLDLEDAAYYSAGHDDWQLHQPQAMRYVRGRVLDIGCGVGRHAL